MKALRDPLTTPAGPSLTTLRDSLGKRGSRAIPEAPQPKTWARRFHVRESPCEGYRVALSYGK